MRRSVLAFLITAAAAAPAPARAAEAARIGQVFYEPQRQTIVVPFVGRPPDAAYYRLSGTRHYWEFSGARLVQGVVQHQPIGGDIKRYTVAPRGAGVVRLAFELTIEARPTLRFDAPNHRFEIYPFGEELVSGVPAVRVPRELPLPIPTPAPAVVPRRPVVASPRPTPKAPASWQAAPLLRVPHGLLLPLPSPRTTLGRPEAGDGGLLVPFKGPAPDYEVQVYAANPRWLYFAFNHVGVVMTGKRFGLITDPAIDAWMFTEPAPGQVRLYLRLKRTMPVVAQVLEDEGRIRFASPHSPGGVTPPAPGALPAAAASGEPAEPRAPQAPLPPAAPVVPEPEEGLPEGAGPLLFPRPDSAN